MRIAGLRRGSVYQLVLAPLAAGGQLSLCGGNKHEAHSNHLEAAERARQYKEAVVWCKENGKRGYAASHRKDEEGNWWWPLVTEGSCNRRLAGTVDIDHPFSARQVLTPQEESDIVATCKELNAHAQGIERAQLGKMVLDSLLLRPVLNAGREFAPYSTAARNILEAGEVGQAFFTRFFADNPTLTEKRPASEEIMRAKWMTPAVSASHFEKLKACCMRAGIMDSSGNITDARRLLNSDECPNPWRGTGDRGKLIAEVGKPCLKLVTAAREHTSLDVLVGLDGWLGAAHLIFKGEYIQRQMIPDRSKVPNSKISATPKGYQTGSSLLETLKIWDRQLVARGVPKPVVWTTDGHSSRLNTDVLSWCRENGWIMYISPPHTTGIHQALDQIFKSWHDTFNGIVKRWCDENTGKELNKQIFTDIFAEAWPRWTTPDKIVAAFRRVGITVNGLDPDSIPKHKFVISTTVAPALALPAPSAQSNETAPAEPTPVVHDAIEGSGLPLAQGAANQESSSTAVVVTTPSAAANPLLTGEYQSPSPDPALFQKDTKEYWKEKQRLTSKVARGFFATAKALQQTPLTLKETHPSWQVRKVEPVDESTREKGKQRVKGAWGDMDSEQMLEKLLEQDDEEDAAKERALEKKRDAEQRRIERAALEAEKKQLKEQRLELEGPITHLLQNLGFTDGQRDEVGAKELEAFARANRTELLALEVDLSSLARKNLMAQLTVKLPAATSVVWKEAPPKLLTGPSGAADVAALMPPPPPRAAAEDTSAPHAAPEPVEPATEPSSLEGTPTKPEPKRRATRSSVE